MPKLNHAQLLGSHIPNDGDDGLTIEQLYQLLGSIPRKARDNYIMILAPDGCAADVAGLQFAQSDQAEKWDFKVYLKSNWEVT